MKIVEQKVVFEEEIDGDEIIRKIERAAKTCYRAEHSVGSIYNARSFVRSLIANGHESTIEHVSISARVITNRGVSHEWVRHRVGCSYSQESTRYCNYGKEKFENEITVIWPSWYLGPMPPIEDIAEFNYNAWDARFPNAKAESWWKSMKVTEGGYLDLLKLGCKPEEARGVLPNDLKTEFVTTMTLRAWRHFFQMRCQKAAHPQIRELALQALKILNNRVPAVFEDLAKEYLNEDDTESMCDSSACSSCSSCG
jgi:thymidylate synthase (FAD)